MTSAEPVSTRRRGFRLVLLAPVFALVALVCWGLSSPVGSSPDDDFHLASIWCGSGVVAGQCETGAENDERVVPRDLVSGAVCFATDDEKSASCQAPDFGTDVDDTVSTDRGNFAGQYPPVFYFVMSLFAGPNVVISVAVMRIVNAVIFIGMVTVLAALLPAHRRTPFIWAAAVTVVPLGMFLIPSTNPSSWAILSAAVLWAALIGYYEASGARRIALGAYAVVASVMGAGSRADSAVYVGLAIVAVTILTAQRTRGFLVLSILPAALFVYAFLSAVLAQQTAVVSTGFDSSAPLEASPATLAIANFLMVPELWTGMFGSGGWGLGWLDTRMPAIVWAIGFLIFGATILIGIAKAGRRKLLSAGLVFAALWLIPIVILVLSRSLVGAYLQPRYILPIAILLAGIALWTSSGVIAITGIQRVITVCALAVANAVALELNIRRYVTGTDVVGLNLDAGAEWWWPSIVASPMTVWIVGSLSFVALLVVLERHVRVADRTVALTTGATGLLPVR